MKSSPNPTKPSSAPLATASEQIDDAQMARYAELIYNKTGIRIPPIKKTLLSNRIRRRLRETGIADFEKYYEHLRGLKPADKEWDAFLQEITTHETYLFRDETQWDWFRGEYLPQMAARAAPQSLRIWSAACSTGDEAYTIATCVAAGLANFERWKVTILGTDIGVGAVEAARAPLFGERAMRLVPESFRKSYFARMPNANAWQPKPTLSRMTQFKQHNLMQPLAEPPFDLVFVKNVLIYFDAASKRTVMGHVLNAIRPGGYLVAGAAEGVSDLVKDLERIQPWLYRKPGGK